MAKPINLEFKLKITGHQYATRAEKKENEDDEPNLIDLGEEFDYEPGEIGIIIQAEDFSADVRGKREGFIKLILTNPGEYTTDVFFEDLLESDNTGKKFVIHQLKEKEVEIRKSGGRNKYLRINRKSYHNISSPTTQFSGNNLNKYGES